MSASGSHRARKKKKVEFAPSTRNESTKNIVTVEKSGRDSQPEFPLVAFLWPGRGTTSQWIILPLILIAVGLFRWTTGLWGYSGKSVMTPFGHC